ncbi:unnamed protein product [Caenorhabditis nigoni]
MSVSEEKKFVMRHVFVEFPRKLHERCFGPEEKHFGLPWRTRIERYPNCYAFCLDCLIFPRAIPGFINIAISLKIMKKIGNHFTKHKNFNFLNLFGSHCLTSIPATSLEEYLINGVLTVKLEVEIKEISGIEFPKLRKFDDDVAKQFSDVVLSAGDQQFYVNKMYLSMHSTYFNSLFSGNYAESEKSIIELKDINPWDFQNFLELIHGDSALEDDTVNGILKLSDYFNAKNVIGRCERFLLKNSKKSIKDKFNLAIQYKLEKLKEKSISELKTHADILSIVPEDPSFLDPFLWKELLLKYSRIPK